MTLTQSPSEKSITLVVVRVLATLSIILLTLLSMWAVGQVQWEKGEAGNYIHFWYLIAFLLCEAWTALGLILLGQLYINRNWPAFVVTLGLWVPALVLSGMQENEFHKQEALKKRSEFAVDIQAYKNAEARLVELSGELSLLPVQRPVEAIEAELALYEARPLKYPTKISELKSEYAVSQQYQSLLIEQKSQRKILEDKAAISTQYGDEVDNAQNYWVLIGWMMAMKACGAWVLSCLGKTVSRQTIQIPLPEKVLPHKDLPKKALDGRPMRIMT